MVLAELGGKLRESLRKLQTARSSNSSDQGNNKDLVNEVLADICRALISADVNVRLVSQMRTAVLARIEQHTTTNNSKQASSSTAADAKIVQRAVVDELTNLLSTSTKPTVLKRGKTSIVLFVGLQGAGKTTTVAKYAFYHAKKGFKVAMVCADTFRAGAFDQLKQNATKLRIPFYGSYTTADPVAIAKAGVEKFRAAKYELILVDTSGRHKQQMALLDEMSEIAEAIQPIAQTILVVDGTQGQAVYDQAAAFHAASAVGAVIVTKLDGHAVGGGALSAVAATDAPVVFTGTGEHFDDLEIFAADRFVSKLLGFGDLKGLMEAMKTDDKTMERMQKGEFTLRDMYNQLEVRF
jgi:signal recognition particle subunit SRP54